MTNRCTSRMHILFLTDNFPPEVNAPASRTFEHCREWVRAGHRVTVITCAPNFPQGRVFPPYRNRLWQQEEREGIRVIRVWSYMARNEGFLRRTLDYLSYMLAASLAAPFVRQVDVVVGTSPQFFTACAAWFTATLKRVPWVFELRDLWPESIRAVGAMGTSRLLDAMERVELFLYRRADAVVSVTHAFRDNLARRGIDTANDHVVTNGVDIRQFSPRPKDPELLAQLGLQGRFIAGYIGTHGMAHALDTLLDAAYMLRQRADGQGIHLLMIGDGAEKARLVEVARQRGLDNLSFIDSVAKEQVARYWSLLDVALIHLRDTELFSTVIPSKLFECMGMGVPVLHGVPGESAAIVRGEQVGDTFKPQDPQALADALVALRDDPARLAGYRANGPNAAARYDRTHLAARMLQILQSLVRQP